MIKIVIVEDDLEASATLKQHIDNYKNLNKVSINIESFESAVSFLANYKADADIIFMDIKMPNMTGMDAAKDLRKIDDSVIIIFVTDMIQYAVKGYSVNALDFIIKPMTYFNLNNAMNKAIRIIDSKDKDDIILKNNGLIRRIPINTIKYIEVHRHKITYHTEDGEFEGWGTLDNLEKALPEKFFSRCNISFLIGLKHVKTIDGNDIIIGDTRLKISRNRKKEFLASVAKYLGSNV